MKREKEVSYVISVSLGTGCYRHIKISSNATLDCFAQAVLDAFEFDNDHLYAFFLNNKRWDNGDAYYSDNADSADRLATHYKLKQVGLTAGKKFLYLFDFGDDWTFNCKVLRILEEETKKPEVIRSKGEAPEQYYDEYEEEYDEEDFDDDDD